MRRFAPRTVRTKLTLMTMGVIALLLLLVGTISEVSARAATYNSIDRDLERRGNDFIHVVTRGPGGRGMGPPPGMPKGFRPQGPPPGMGRGRPRVDPNWVTPIAIAVPRNGAEGPFHDTPYDEVGYARAAKGERNWHTVWVGDEPRRVYSVPGSENGKILAVVQVAYPMGEANASLDQLHRTLVQFSIPVGIILGGIASFFLVGQLIQPLRRITQDAERIGSGGFGERLETRGNDEFAALAATLNGMLERLSQTYHLEQETSRRLQQTVEQQRRFTSDASHELKTPLAVIKANTGVMLHGKSLSEPDRESLGAIDAAAGRMGGLIRDLLVLARTDAGRSTGQACICEVSQLIDEAISSVPGAAAVVRFDPIVARVHASPEDLTRVFTNLIENALKHSGSNVVAVIASVSDGTCTIQVRDEGVGIDAEHLPHLFERFYRADASRTSDTGGSGLGLAICKAIVEANGGTIAVQSELGRGTEFVVSIPAVD